MGLQEEKFPNIGLTPSEVKRKVLLVCGEDTAELEAAMEELGIGYRRVAGYREFRTYDVEMGGAAMTLCLTGIGSASVEIAVTEFYKCGGREFVHTGTCGVLSGAFGVGDVVLVTAAERHDGASFHYVPRGRVSRADSGHLRRAARILKREGINFGRGRIISTDTFYCMGAARGPGGAITYPGVPLKAGFFPPPKFLAFKKMLESGRPYIIDMEAATFLTLCSIIDDELFYVSVKGVANAVPFVPGEQVENTKSALGNALRAACAILSGAGV